MAGTAPVQVLHLIKGLGPGGAERLLVSMAQASEPLEVHHEVAYLLPWKDHLVPELEAAGVPTHLLASRRALTDPRWPFRLRRLARRFDVVHVHSPAVAALARPVVRSLGRRPVLVSTEHNRWASHGRLTRAANSLTSSLDDQRWAVSQEVVESMGARGARGVDVLVHGIPVGALRARRTGRAAARAALGWHQDDVVVAIVANLRHQKDYPTLLQAARVAIDASPSVRYVAIGQGPLEDELRAMALSLSLGDRFSFLGYHEDPPAVLSGADVFTLSSRHEGLPISLLEAMALELPPVATAVGGIPEVIRDGQDGILVPPQDPAALADAHLRLAADPRLRAALGRAAAARASEFDITRTARIVEARYRELALAARS
jgi:glycosyltransferase involved in cell wall biosynthesis